MYVTEKELLCKETGKEGAELDLKICLNALRVKLGKPLRITSGYRSPEHSIEAKKVVPGTHSKGIAADVAIMGHNPYEIIKHAMEVGFTGIGINLKKGFIHLDLRKTEPTVFLY